MTDYLMQDLLVSRDGQLQCIILRQAAQQQCADLAAEIEHLSTVVHSKKVVYMLHPMQMQDLCASQAARCRTMLLL